MYSDPNFIPLHLQACARLFLLSTIFSLQTSLFAQAPPQQPEFVKPGQQLIREGKADQALALHRSTLQTSPDSLPASLAAGSVLDLMGKVEEARKYFSKAIEIADTPEHKSGAKRAMAITYAFETNCAKAIEVRAAGVRLLRQREELLSAARDRR